MLTVKTELLCRSVQAVDAALTAYGPFLASATWVSLVEAVSFCLGNRTLVNASVCHDGAVTVVEEGHRLYVYAPDWIDVQDKYYPEAGASAKYDGHDVVVELHTCSGHFFEVRYCGEVPTVKTDDIPSDTFWGPKYPTAEERAAAITNALRRAAVAE